MSPEIEVATLNLRKGELRWEERRGLLLEQLDELGPDVIGFQEVDLRIDQGNWICSRLNEIRRGRAESEYLIHHMANPRENAAYEALAIMTRLPIADHTGHDYLIRNRVAHRARLMVEDRPIDFWNTHFHHVQDRAGNEMRVRQAEALREWLDHDGSGIPKVVVGDFNSPPGTKPIRILEENVRSAFAAANGTEPDRTAWTPLGKEEHGGNDPPSGAVVDYILVSAEVRVRACCLVFDRPHEKDPSLYPSDHFGISATIEF